MSEVTAEAIRIGRTAFLLAGAVVAAVFIGNATGWTDGLLPRKPVAPPDLSINWPDADKGQYPAAVLSIELWPGHTLNIGKTDEIGAWAVSLGPQVVVHCTDDSSTDARAEECLNVRVDGLQCRHPVQGARDCSIVITGQYEAGIHPTCWLTFSDGFGEGHWTAFETGCPSRIDLKTVRPS